MSATHLDRIQRWMQAVIMHPEGVVAGIGAPEARLHIPISPDKVEQLITRSQQLTSIERLQIYANAYYARLLECLREEFSALLHAVGEEAFDAFAFGYLQKYPSMSYTLGDLGASFPRYLAETQPGGGGEAAGDETWPEFLVELATLERLYSEIFDGPGVEGKNLLGSDQLATIPADRWPDARLVPVSCLHVVRFRLPVHEYITAVRNKTEPAWPNPADTYLAVTRRDYVIRRVPLSRLQYVVLHALTRRRTVGEAISRAVKLSPNHVDGLAESLHRWFADWTAAGFFQAVELPE